MKVIKCDFLVKDFNTIEQKKAVVFDKFIKDIIDQDKIYKKYKNALVYDFSGYTLMPAFINSHLHLEFNKGRVYGDFLNWLKDIVFNPNLASKKEINKSIDELKKSGVGTICENSSFFNEAKILKNSGLRVFFYNEIIGSNENKLEISKENFLKRFNLSLDLKDELFTPAIAIHSPYSVHPYLLKEALNLAKKYDLLVGTHFLESIYEFNWLKSKKGKFKSYLKNLSNQNSPMYLIDEYRSKFNNFISAFYHCVYESDFSKFDDKKHFIVHCARSNALLGKKRLNLKKVKNLCIGTDGISSNINLNFFDELRANLMMHYEFDKNELAKILLKASTITPAKMLNLKSGVLKKDYLADFFLVKSQICDLKDMLLNIILYTKEVKNLFVQGEKVW